MGCCLRAGTSGSFCGEMCDHGAQVWIVSRGMVGILLVEFGMSEE